jgi:hypothetical protein
VVPVATGHSFHAMPGALASDGLAGMKFFGVVPGNRRAACRTLLAGVLLMPSRWMAAGSPARAPRR